MDDDAALPTAPDSPERLDVTVTTGAAAGALHARRLPASIGHYRILDLVGEGGMGAVYKAEQQQPRRTVALKVIKAGLATSDLLRRFEQEAQALGRLQHPGIAQIHEAGTADTGFGPQPYFAMEFIRGESLLRYAGAQHLNASQRLELIAKVCDAVHHAHQRGIIHRDLKPGNILVDESGQPKILDFGVARVTDRDAQATRQTDLGQLVGTLAYMSPEQVLGDPLELDTRSDVYSLGLILYELLAGRVPYILSRKLHEAVQSIREEDPAPLSTVSRTYRGDIETIVAKALEKDKARRYASAADLAADIRRFLKDEPIVARPPTTAYQLHKFALRHKALVGGLGAVLVVLVLGVVASTWQALRATQAEKAALRERDRTSIAERSATKERDRAKANFALARQAVDKTITRVAEDERLKQADFHQLRRDLLASVVPFYEEFVRQPGADAPLEAERGRAYARLGYVRDEMGEKERAVEAYQQKRVIFARLAGTFPDVPAYQEDLAKSDNSLGIPLADLGKRAEAETAYRAALGIQERLVTGFPAVPDYRRDLAATHNNLGNLMKDVGRRVEAEAAYRAALGIQQRLAADFPAVPGYRRDMALSHNNLGVLLSGLGKVVEAEAAYRAALGIQERLATDFPAMPGYRRELAASHNNLGNLLREVGKPVEAEAAHRAALGLYERLAADFPAVPVYRQELARGHNSLGNLMRNLGKTVEAEAAFRAALGIRERLVADFPTMPDYAVELAGSYVNLGHLVRESGQPQASLDWFAKGIATLEPVLRTEPRLVTARQFLRNAQYGRAQALARLGRHAEALRDWDRVLELDSGPDRNLTLTRRALTLALSGDHVRASAEADELAQAKDVTGGALYNLACVYALSSAAAGKDAALPKADHDRLSERHAARAVELLGKAQAAGYFKGRTTVSHMKADSDLDPLRARPDFQKLLRELEGKPQ